MTSLPRWQVLRPTVLVVTVTLAALAGTLSCARAQDAASPEPTDAVIEEATKKASAFAVFEPNDATTWLKVKGMIDAYLYGLWEQGALQGSTPDAAFFVNVGLGKTMTAQDILEGRMIVEIGIAAVRPAEFIIIRFSHKLAES